MWEAYNSAGERVAVIAKDLGFYQRPSSMETVSAVAVPGGGASAAVSVGGAGLLFWDGSTDGGQEAASGSYTLVLTLQDPFGGMQTYSAGVMVLRQPGALSLEVYNSAGELVRALPVPATVAGQRLSVDKTSLMPGVSALNIQVGSGASASLVWDGLNGQGQAVSAGTYYLQLRRPDDPKGASETVAVTVLSVPVPQLQLFAAPNPARARQVLRLWAPGSAGTLRIEAYNLAGERVGGISGPAAGLRWPLGGWSGGIYLLRGWLDEGGQRLPLAGTKIAVLD